MFTPRLDDDAADRLLAGRIVPQDAPRGFQGVAAVVQAVLAPPVSAEVAGERDAVEAAIRMAGADAELRQLTIPGRTPMRTRSLRLKLTGAVAGALVVASGGLAFAGALPSAAQDAVSNALSHVGITVPTSDDHPTSEGYPASTGEEISGIATTTESEGVDKGAEISGIASGGMSQAGQHGAPDGTSGATGPDSGTGLADEESDAAADAGTGTADGESDGRSADGSGNGTP